MGHTLTNVHTGGHIYKEGGCGELTLDISQFLASETITETRDLPGFSTDRVTYKSHHFQIHLCRYSRNPEGKFSGVLISVHHGGGWEVWRGDYMLADALARYGNDDRGAFWLCWYLLDMAKERHAAGRVDSAREYRAAFVEGRLKKRKMPRRSDVKVWIEPATEPA